ncbi:TPA: hypothetical protein MYQ41_003527 [Citrobacter amalonaticus]|nr:hypothetical protein [Citrobacter amalonaticus]HCB1890339.1 hypothetical protein [Citrobacter amalonaticus]HCB1912294.1 hypothetical protein [Citrobacter amalonaticus]
MYHWTTSHYANVRYDTSWGKWLATRRSNTT